MVRDVASSVSTIQEAQEFFAQGFGADRPIADNRDFIGRAKNRRIEFVIMQKLDAGP